MQKQVNENGNNMWGMLTAEDFQPILEFDFLGPDSWAAGGRSEAEVAAMGAADKMDLRARQVGLSGQGQQQGCGWCVEGGVGSHRQGLP